MKVKMSRMYITILACLSLSGCQAVNDTLASVNDALKSVNSVLSGSTISATTQNSVNSALDSAKPNNSTKTLFNKAKPTMNKVLGLLACLPDGSDSNSQLMIYSDPDSVAPHSSVKPQSKMSYHKSGCLNVTRVTGFKKLAANSFEFQAYFTSPQSGETVSNRYHAIQQPNGEWLFDFWGL